MPVKSGLTVLLAGNRKLLAKRRVGILTHAAAVNHKFQTSWELIPALTGCRLHVIFGPEHGLYAAAQDMESVAQEKRERSGVPVVSLYGSTPESLKPSARLLRDLDVLVVDLQDVGSRYYTFIYSMAFCMQAAAKAGVAVLVLDRPNPLGGFLLEGNLGLPEYSSFVGAYPLPVRHGMTIGELAGYFKEHDSLDLNLKVMKMQGWRRGMWFAETGLPWVLPSPNMPTPDTALVYPGMCLLEGTNISEGRGSTRPFEIFGAPFIDPWRFKKALEEERLPGIAWRPLYFRPTFHKWQGQTCGGLELRVTSRERFRPWRTGLAVLRNLIRLYPKDFAWRREPYEFEAERPAIDLLLKDPELRQSLEKSQPLDRLTEISRKELRRFSMIRENFFLYA